MTEVISSAEQKSFSDFMDNIRPYLDQKLRDNQYFQEKAEELRKYQDMKSSFEEISKYSNN